MLCPAPSNKHRPKRANNERCENRDNYGEVGDWDNKRSPPPWAAHLRIVRPPDHLIFRVNDLGPFGSPHSVPIALNHGAPKWPAIS